MLKPIKDWAQDALCNGLFKVAQLCQTIKTFEPRRTFKWVAPIALKDGSLLTFVHGKPSAEAARGSRRLTAYSEGHPVFQTDFLISPRTNSLFVTEFKLMDPDHNARRGIGSKVMQRLTEFAETMPSVNNMSLLPAPLSIDGKHVIEGDGLLTFYRKAGFNPETELPGFEFMSRWDKPVRAATPLERLPIHGALNRLHYTLNK
jgi:hypothetical protein